MDFATWAKENPTETAEYQLLIQWRDQEIKFISEFEARLQKAHNGKYQYENYEYIENMNHSAMYSKYRPLPKWDENTSSELRKLLDEQDKLIKQINDQLDLETKLAIEIATCEAGIDYAREQLSKREQDIRDFQFYLLERQRHPNSIPYLETVLNQRLGVIWEKISGGDTVTDEAFDFVAGMTDNGELAVEYSDIMYHAVFKLNGVQNEAYDTERPLAVLNAWIDFVETHWGYFIGSEQYEYDNADE